MSWPEYLPSFDQLNYEANDIHTNNASQDDDNENTYFISDTSESETSMVQNTGRGLGYVIVIKRFIANSNIFFQCDRSSTYKSKKTSTKNTGTKKINCPFALKGKYSSKDNCWSLKAICEMQNHEPALYFEGHPYPRHLSVDETQLVEDLIRKNVKPKDILSTLKKENVENLSILPTIYNSHQKFRMKENSGKTQMQVVMSFLAENGYIYYSHADKSTNELQDLLFAHQRSLEMYEIPLLEIVGVTPTNQTFCVAFVYMHKET
uniref:FAR1 domain-containing protein n=1 Tax=Lactuca sativa TaxID=4236 RepID=A0A9R1XCP1_LACSA|nr:hypothetical protein LSAT_V11C500242000 [Lactuca sativa]